QPPAAASSISTPPRSTPSTSSAPTSEGNGLIVDSSPTRLSEEESVAAAVYARCHESVVFIETKAVEVDRFFGRVSESEGAGSGSIVDRRGHVLTNFHVVKDANDVMVTLADGQQFQATVVGADPQNDIAVLRMNATPSQFAKLQPVIFGRSENLMVGQRVFALGSPLGLEQTMTSGVVSSLNRTLPTENHRLIKSVIQIDAALNRGSSGGPLMDSNGRVIGMNTAIASRVGESSGIGFSIPAATLIRIVPQLIKTGRINRPVIGVEAIVELERGLRLVRLLPGGPAERAGLRGVQEIRRRTNMGGYLIQRDMNSGDILLKLDGQAVTSIDDMLTIVESHRPGETITATVLRNGTQLSANIRLASQ
ncbi:MAG: trypsin-like peptidase domain-containing protein, partial [Planctomycetota bacterium]